ncbi:MAG: hypothetical protein Kow0010_18530 [Dehalococcoidia bacterium]
MPDGGCVAHTPLVPGKETEAIERRVRRDWTARLVTLALVLVLLVAFIAQNFETVEVRVLLFDAEVRLAYALLFAAALGFGVGLLFPRLRRR